MNCTVTKFVFEWGDNNGVNLQLDSYRRLAINTILPFQNATNQLLFNELVRTEDFFSKMKRYAYS